jgi:HEAT repeat protein
MKEQLHYLLVNEDYEAIVELAGHKRRVLSFLTALTYDPDSLLSWRAVEAIGLAAGCIADDDPEFVRIHLRRLQWLLNDESGGIGWRAPEAMGEIIYNRPQQFAEFVPIVISLFDMEEEDVIRFRPGILWAVGRLGQVMPEAVKPAIPWVVPCLDDLNPQTRGLAVWCLGQLDAVGYLADQDALLRDESPVDIYIDGQLAHKSVTQLVRETLAQDKK